MNGAVYERLAALEQQTAKLAATIAMLAERLATIERQVAIVDGTTSYLSRHGSR